MPLHVNSRLGPYEIRSMLGQGGMGEVYRARDSRLNRDVALKVLRQDSAASADHRSRFEQEARAVAALNHPNIVSVYDFCVESGQQFIVSELIEGESLRSIFTGKAIPVRKLVDIAAQVADGLAAAHAAGFTHRDLKPENIMLTREGRVKILDFGLARRTAATAKSSDETVIPDAEVTRRLTRQGALMGTADYMSPEQAVGQEADYRSDQFSFGLVLHEMASGKQAFARASTVETMAAIVRDEPPPIDEKVPPPLRWIIDRCLQKEPAQRYESTRDLFQDLRTLRDHLSESYSSGAFTAIAPQAKPRRWKIAAVCLGGAFLAALFGYLLRPVGQDIGKYRYTPFASNALPGVWSPDGTAVAYTGFAPGASQVFLRYLNSPVPLQLTHQPHNVAPVGWSADRTHLILAEDTGAEQPPYDKLYSVPTVGGDPEFIMDFDCLATCALSPDGKVLATFAQGRDKNYSILVSDPVGSPLRPYAPAPFATKTIIGRPQLDFSPDNKKILLFYGGENDKPEAWLLPYPDQGKSPHRVLQQLPNVTGDPSFSWMPDSRHIVVSLTVDQHSTSHLWMADTESEDRTPLTTGTTDDSVPAVSPDGKSILYCQEIHSLDVVSLSLEDGAAKTLITTGRMDSDPAWAADENKLAWVTNRSGPWEIWFRSPDGSERPAITAADFNGAPTKWFMTPSLSPHGDRLIFTRVDTSGIIRLWLSSLAGGSPVRLTNAESGSEFGGSWSPDGSRVVYHEYIGGKGLLKIVKTSGGATPLALASEANVSSIAAWSPFGDWITYADEKGWHLISPDGKNSRFLGKITTDYLAFSKDGKQLYGIMTGTNASDRDRAALFSLDLATLKQKVIKELGKDLQPSDIVAPGIRFSLAPDGKSFVYATEKRTTSIWNLQGYSQPNWWNRLFGR